MLAELDKWPLALQVMAFVGAAVAGAFIYLRSLRAPPAQMAGSPVEIERIRSDLAMTIEALKVSFNDQFDDLRERCEDYDNRMREAEIKLAVIYDRYDRSGR